MPGPRPIARVHLCELRGNKGPNARASNAVGRPHHPTQCSRDIGPPQGSCSAKFFVDWARVFHCARAQIDAV